MGGELRGPAHERRLNSWKEIAAFLGRTERTAKRWEASQGLPVRRVPSSGRGSVFAYEHELRNWLNGNKSSALPVLETPEKPATNRYRITAALGLTAVALIASLILFGQREPAGTQNLGTRDAVAAQLYRSGQHEWQTRTPTGLAKAIQNFRGAIARDHRFAMAYLGLGDAYILASEFTTASAVQTYALARDAITQALKLDPHSSGAHAALGFLDFYERHKAADAKREFEEAVSLNPDDPIARHWYATVSMTTGDFRKADREINAAENLDSESTAIVADKALIQFYEGRKQDAVRTLRQIESDQPAFLSAHSYLAYMNLAEGDDPGYLRELKQVAMSRKDSEMGLLAARGADGLAQRGHTGMLQALLDARLAHFSSTEGSAYEIGKLYALMGDTTHALAFLRESERRSEPEAIALKIDVTLDAIRNRPEFARLLSDFGLNQ